MFKFTKMSKRDMLKKATAAVVGYGTGVIVVGIVKSNVPTGSIIKKIGVAAATFALVGIVATETENYTNHFIDDLFSGYDEYLEAQKTKAA